MGGVGMAYAGSGYNPSDKSIDHSLRSRVAELERKVGRLELANRVLWEMLRDGLKLTEQQMEERMQSIDLRDGVEDGKVSVVPMRCPTCKRVSSSKHWKCLYCGLEFEQFVY